MQTSNSHETVFLLVEDDPNDAFFVQREFNRAANNIQLRVATDGAQAIEYLEGSGMYSDRDAFPIPNVILLDLNMPRVGGFEFLQWLRQSAPKRLRVIPVLVMSSSHLPQDVRRAYELGANSYFVKPVNWKEFSQTIAGLGIYWSRHVLTPTP